MRSIECAGGRYEIDGHLGYKLRPGNRLRELYPETCLNGHRARVTMTWGNDCRAITCRQCWDAGLPHATAYYCTCQLNDVSPDRPEIPPVVIVPGPHRPSS